MDDAYWMRQAVEEAVLGFGKTSPNPLVGAVIVKDNVCLARGYHKKAGEAHAEINALRECDSRGASLFVTLEPCSSHGRTGPCTDAVIKAGISRVVIGTLDPNPAHAGRGVAILEDAGIEVVHSVEKALCQELNESFNCWIRYGRPYIILKLAMTLDGRIATESGHSQWITGDEARAEVQNLRRAVDAIMVGAETVRQDNPQLLVRDPADWDKQPLRLICSRDPAFNGDYQVFTDEQAPTELISCTTKEEWQTKLNELGEREICSVLVEGGGELAAELLFNGLVDKLVFFYAPKILGGKGSRPAVGGLNPQSLDEALVLEKLRPKVVGNDLMLTGYLTDVHRFD